MEFDVMQLVSTIGVPATVCFVLLFQFRKALDDMRSTIENNTKAIVAITTLVQGGKNNVSE